MSGYPTRPNPQNRLHTETKKLLNKGARILANYCLGELSFKDYGFRFLILPGLLALISCGTFETSFEVQSSTPEREFSELPGYIVADNAILLGYTASDLQVSPGGELDLKLHWELDEAPAYAYTVAIRLVGARDAPPVWQHSDPTIRWVEGYQVTHHQLHFSSQIAPRNYGVEVWLQHPETGVREPVIAPDGPISDRVIPLVTLRVTDEMNHDGAP